MEIELLTLGFLFDDSSGVKAMGSSRPATRSTLGLVVDSSKVRDRLWAFRKDAIKAVLADELGQLDKQELLAHLHIINNALGRPLLPPGKATRDVGVAADNAIKKEKKLTAEAKARYSAALSAARAGGDAVGRIGELEAARDAELAEILETECNLQLPNETVGNMVSAKRKRVEASHDPFDALRRAEAAHRAAKLDLDRAEQREQQLGPQPPLLYPAGPEDLAFWRGGGGAAVAARARAARSGGARDPCRARYREAAARAAACGAPGRLGRAEPTGQTGTGGP